MTPPTRNRPPTLIVIAVGILFIVLAVVEAMAETTPWTVRLRQVDEALTKRDVGAAERAWRDAYAAALGSRSWERMLEVGDVARRIGEVTGDRATANARARRAYLAALFQARQQKSLDGVLRVAEAFSSLGDRSAVAQCLRVAERLAVEARDAQARDRVSTLSERLATH